MQGKRGFESAKALRCFSLEVIEGDKQEGRKGGGCGRREVVYGGCREK